MSRCHACGSSRDRVYRNTDMDIPECSKALLRNEAMLDPLHTSSELSPTPDVMPQ